MGLGHWYEMKFLIDTGFFQPFGPRGTKNKFSQYISFSGSSAFQ